MPENYSVAPDESIIVSHVIAAHKWNVYRVCLETNCYSTQHSKGGELLNPGKFWETDAQLQASRNRPYLLAVQFRFRF